LLSAPLVAQVAEPDDRPPAERLAQSERPTTKDWTGVVAAAGAGDSPVLPARGTGRSAATGGARRDAKSSRRSRIRDFFVRRSRWFQDQPTPTPTGSATNAGVGSVPPAVGQTGTPGAPETGGVQPAPPGAAAAPAAVPTVQPALTPLLLNKALGLQDTPYRVWGWIQNSYTGNANGTPRDLNNFTVWPNHLANQWMGNQYYLILENPLNAVDTVNFGWRFDMLFGNDWLFTKDYGLFDRAWPNGYFAGLDLPQIYGEVHLPILTPLGLDIRAGRFFSLTGFESPQAIARPLLSVPYSLNFTPFTFFGAYAKLNVHSRLNVFSGTIDGFDRWPNEPYKWGYIGGFNWTSRDQKMNIVIGGASAFDQLPIFPPANTPYLPVGVPGPGFLSRRPNPFYNKSMRGYIVGVLLYKWTTKLTEVFETDHVFDPEILGYGHDPYTPHSAAYHSFVHWFLYAFTDKLTGVWRTEIFWDPYGLATSNADVYHEITLGLVYKPKDHLWIRPEIRYDWAQYTHPFNDGTRSSQLTMGFDVIFLF
jgi:hypothetical protein